MEPIIRLARATDIPDIYKLVKELAQYEGADGAVTASLETYRNEFKKGTFEAIVAQSEKQIVGTAIYYMAFSTWKGRMLFLEDFVVTQSFRKAGIGQKIFDAVLEEGRKKEAELVKWQVLDWNIPAINFYKKNNAIIDKNWYNGKLFYSKTP